MQNLEELVRLYKEGRLTKYVLEKEFSVAMGNHCEVYIVDDAAPSTHMSYGIFTVPEKRSNGIYLMYFIDKSAIFNFYKAEEFIKAMMGLKSEQQKMFHEFSEFLRSTSANSVSFNEIFAEYLRLYSMGRPHLDVASIGDEFLPGELYVSELIVKFDDGKASEQDVEDLRINDLIPARIIQLARDFAKKSGSDEVIIPVRKEADMVPTFNIGRQEVLELVNSQTDYIGHKDIKYNYLPDTNQ